MFQQAINELKDLRLLGMAEALEDLRGNPASIALGVDDYILKMTGREKHRRDDQRLKRLLRTADLKIPTAVPEDIDYRANRGLDRLVMANLLTCEWIEKDQNLILTGLTGVGKTWLSCSLAQQACRKGLLVRTYRLSRLLEKIETGRGDGTLPKLRDQLGRADLLLLDDLGLNPLTAKARHDLLEVIDDRCGRGSVLITSQLPVDRWYDWVGEPTVADALLDRLVHSAHRIELGGESMRAQRVKH